MARKKSNRDASYPKGKSLIAAGKINPIQWQITKGEAEFALKQLGLPVLEIKRVKCLKYQVCVSYWNTDGKVCSSFFSYRVFERWQKAVETLIQDCQTFEEWDRLGESIEYDLLQFPYPVEMADKIWDAFKDHRYQLKVAVRLAEELAA